MLPRTFRSTRWWYRCRGASASAGRRGTTPARVRWECAATYPAPTTATRTAPSQRRAQRAPERRQCGRATAAEPRSGHARSRITWLADEPVAHTRQRLDVAGRVAHIVQRHAQFAHRDVEPVVEIHDAGRPQSLHQLIARDNRAGVIEELDEDAQRLLGQACGMVAPRDLSRDAVDLPASNSMSPDSIDPVSIDE